VSGLQPPATETPAIAIRRARPSDAEAFARIFSDEDTFGGVLQMPYPSANIWRQRLEENDAPGKNRLVLVAEVDGDVVGNTGLTMESWSPRRSHVASFGIGVAKAWQGHGVGTALMAALIDYADRWAGILRIELTVYADNTRAIALYRKFGFEPEGTMRGFAMRDGRYVDALAMARLHPNPPRIGGGAST
jgi:L-phenylalanine/L-methionine N-acetyltransferase